MKTNARDEKWSEWIDWNGGECPLERGEMCCVKYRNGEVRNNIPAGVDGGLVNAGGYNTADTYWRNDRTSVDIIAYRYKIKEPESDMNPDLEWLARNTRPKQFGQISVRRNADFHSGYQWSDLRQTGDGWYHHSKIEAARQQLGLDSTGIADPDEEECLQLAYERMADETLPTSVKQLRYQDAKGEDWIDEFSRTATVDEFRGAMRFTIGKYNRRAGKKDELIKEIEKMRDYCERWLEYERKVGQ